MYDWDIYDASSKNGSECAKNIAMITADIERIIMLDNEARTNLTNALNGKAYTGFFPAMGDYMYFVADIWATGAQYGHRVEMCNMVLSEEWKTDPIKLLRKFSWDTIDVKIDGYDVKSTITNTPVRSDLFIR